MAPAHVRLRVFQLLLLAHALAQFMLVQFRFQHFHRFGAVAVLRTVVLALHHDAGRRMGHADGGVGLVDVLTAGARRAVGIDADIGRVDVDLDRIVDFRIHEQRRERGMAAVGRVERRLAHQAVHARFRAQEAVGVVALDLQGGRLDAGDLAVGLLEDFDLEALAFAIAQVLAQQHRSPVLGFRAAGAGLDVDEAVVRVHRIVEHPAEFHAFDDLADFLHVLLDRFERVVVAFFAGHVEQVAGVAQVGIGLGQGEDDGFQRLLLFTEVLGAFGIVPDGWIFQFFVDLL